MSKIDDYKKAAWTFQRVMECLYKSTRRDSKGQYDSRNDKAALRINYYGKHTSDWSDAVLTLHASHGYYGSSSGCSDMDKEVAEYMVKALNNNLQKIANEAIELARVDMEKARKEAEEEAKEVLRITA